MSGVKHSYIDEVLKQVRFKFDHVEIRQELEEHIEDMLSFAPPMEDDEAESYVREQMGDPEAVGQALDKEHHVVLGWIWLGLRSLLIALSMCVLLPIVLGVVWAGCITVSAMIEGYEDRYGEPVETIKVEETIQLDDLTIWVDEVVKYENGFIELRYRTAHKLLTSAEPWSFYLRPYIRFDNGQVNVDGGGRASAGWISYCQEYMKNVTEDATKMLLDYDRYGREFYVEIPLEWELIQ